MLAFTYYTNFVIRSCSLLVKSHVFGGLDVVSSNTIEDKKRVYLSAIQELLVFMVIWISKCVSLRKEIM